jgi:hypothetical protein
VGRCCKPIGLRTAQGWKDTNNIRGNSGVDTAGLKTHRCGLLRALVNGQARRILSEPPSTVILADAADPTHTDAGDIGQSLLFRHIRNFFIHDKWFPAD